MFVCQYCGKEFTGRKKKYCCTKCMEIATARLAQKEIREGRIKPTVHVHINTENGIFSFSQKSPSDYGIMQREETRLKCLT